MNVYEAIAASPIGVAWHEVGKQTICKHESCRWSDKNFPDGWQPLYTSPAEYTLGEPLTDQDYNAVNKITGKMYQGTPRPRPVPKLFRSYGADYHLLTDEGRRRLERLLRESEGE